MEVDPPNANPTVIPSVSLSPPVNTEDSVDSNQLPIPPSNQGLGTSSTAHTATDASMTSYLHVEQSVTDHAGGPIGGDGPSTSIHHGVRGLLSLMSVPPTEGPFVCLTVDQFRSLEAAAAQIKQTQASGCASGPSGGDPTAELPGDDGGYDPDDEEPTPRQRRIQTFPEKCVHVRFILLVC